MLWAPDAFHAEFGIAPRKQQTTSVTVAISGACGADMGGQSVTGCLLQCRNGHRELLAMFGYRNFGQWPQVLSCRAFLGYVVINIRIVPNVDF